jgi:exopolysaccharide production protein ExoY
VASLPIVRETASVSGPVWHTVEVCERAAAVVLMAALSPLMAASAAAVWLRSGRSPWIAHRRVGWRGETLWMFKLRTMWPEENETAAGRSTLVEYIDGDGAAEAKRADDPRVSGWLARFCRRHSIDELPQLWHVIRGEMALIGPRPVTEPELRTYYGLDSEELLQVKPGIAGLWQTSGRNKLTYAERRAMDLRFVRERSLGMYAGILMRTFREIWSGSNTF